jgi:hypothetical protein
MSKEAIKQRKLLVKKLKERGVSITNPLFEHGHKIDRLAGNDSWSAGNKVKCRSASTRAKYGSHSKGHSPSQCATQGVKVIVKHIPVTLSIAELSKASGMFKGVGGTKQSDKTNKVADQFAKEHPEEARKTQTNLQYYYTNVGKGWTKKSKKPIDSPES